MSMLVSRSRGKPHNLKTPTDRRLSSRGMADISNAQGISESYIQTESTAVKFAVKLIIKEKMGRFSLTVTEPISKDKKEETKEFRNSQMPNVTPKDVL